MRSFVLLSFSVGLAFAQQSSDEYLMNVASGTSRNPESASMPMLMRTDGSWLLSLMGQAFLVDTQQSSPRGGDKLYSTNWIMGSASHALFGGSVMFDTMMSLEDSR